MNIPKRKHGSKYNNNTNLPSHTPIIGLGCSSFSTFFLDNNETATTTATTTATEEFTNVCQTNAQTKIQKSNPIVQSWIQTIHYAIENGITLLDTAPWYGHGTSEVVIGYAMEDYLLDSDRSSTCYNRSDDERCASQRTKRRKDLIINTKVGRYDSNPKDQFDFTYQTTIQSVKRSIERMKCTYIDTLQIHDAEFAFAQQQQQQQTGDDTSKVDKIQILIEETIPALLYCRDELKIVKAIGLTGYPLEVQHHILTQVKDLTFDAGKREEGREGGGDHGSSKMMTNNNKVVFDQCLTYCHFNLHSQALFTKPIQTLDSTTATHRRPLQFQHQQRPNKQSFAYYCKQNKIPLMAAAPLSMGLLTNYPPRIPKWHPASQSLQKACHDASMIAKRHNNVDLPTLAIIYALVNGNISCTLLGMANKKQVDVALDVVKRVGNISYDVFNDVDDNDNNGDSNDIKHSLKDKIASTLKLILTDDEMNVLNILMDDVDGPFATVWSNGEYEWDGVLEAEKFWLSSNFGE